MMGNVYLVGAGPGDPELLTVKALRIIGSADVILHDDLVERSVLELAPAGAQVFNVGKRCGRKEIRQQEIHALMVAFANDGLNVVRLHGGDPLIFGRAGEEMEALRFAGVRFEVVPGVTAATAAAASAGITLTDRRVSSSVVLVTGHCRGGAPRTDWERLASAKATVAIYMPGTDYGRLAQDLMSAGWDRETPCLILSRASSSEEESHVTRLEDLSRAPRFDPPCIIIAGAVVGSGHRSPVRGASLNDEVVMA